MIKKRWFVLTVVLILMFGLTAGVAGAEEINTVEDFEVDYLAAPAVAGLLLEAAGIDNRYGTGRNGGNYIKDVADHMCPGTDFNEVSKDNVCDYEFEIANFLNGILQDGRSVVPRKGTFDPIASGAKATDNAAGTVTLEITVLDLCGNGITGLKPTEDFKVFDSVIGGPYYFGTDSIPGSADWDEQDGVYTIELARNYFNARPAGYENGWYRIWDIYVKDELVEKGLEIKTTYCSVGDWKLDLYVGTKLNERFIIINEQNDGDIEGFFGVGYDPDGNPTGEITGTIVGRKINMTYKRTDIVTNYTAEFIGTIASDGNSMSGTWSEYWYMERQ